ncbi:MAG: hypothetical protein HC790_02550 [Acaryochloridaceae cyanobacterium CSU_3_4]|nr:hypothetical protein [Acaryochloridaceae cyanobacterium CSU_3_4]
MGILREDHQSGTTQYKDGGACPLICCMRSPSLPYTLNPIIKILVWLFIQYGLVTDEL